MFLTLCFFIFLTVIPSWKNSHFQIRIMKREGSNAQLYIFLVELTCETLRFDTLSTEKEQLSDRGVVAMAAACTG